VSSKTTRYQHIFDYSKCYEDVAWEDCSVFAWDSLEAIAIAYQTGQLSWVDARRRVDAINAEVHGV